jgi:hypothetical protein
MAEIIKFTKKEIPPDFVDEEETYNALQCPNCECMGFFDITVGDEDELLGFWCNECHAHYLFDDLWEPELTFEVD